MRILIVNNLLQGGGVEKLMHDIVMCFHKKHEITILTEDRDMEFDKIYPDNVGYLYQTDKVYQKGKNAITRRVNYCKRRYAERKLCMKIQDMNFDVMLAMKEGWVMLMALKYGQHIPKRIVWVHTDYLKSYYTKECFGTAANEVNSMKSFHHVICVSQVILESIQKKIGDPGNLVLQYNPIDKTDIIQKSLEKVEDIQRSERLLFVTVGRLNIQKGYDILLEVCNLLNAEGYQYDVWIVGAAEHWNEYSILRDLEDKIHRYHLDNVYLLGHRDNPHKYVKQADWFLSTSRFEGYSYVSQEAAIIGKSLMLTDCSGVMELLGSEENGIVMENSFKGIYYAMKSAIEDSDMAKRYADRIKIEEQEYYGEKRFKEIEKMFSE